MRQDAESAAPPSPGFPLRSLLAALAASGLGCAVASALVLHTMAAGHDLRYSDTGLPMLVAADGYHYLHRSAELLAGRADWLREPGLSVLGAALQLLTRQPLELAAFWLPALLAALSGLWLWGWGRLLRAPAGLTALAAFAGGLVPAWALRASPGWYDTDPGIAFFWHGGLFATACLGLSPGRPRARHALLLAACALGLGWWWRPGLVMLPLCLFLWGATFAFAEDRFWRRLRLAVCVVLGFAAALFLLLPLGALPAGLAVFRNYARVHFAMSTGASGDLVFQSISELKALGVQGVLEGLGGNAPAGVLALCATLLLCWRHPRACAYLLPSFLLLGLSFSAQRFLFFAALPVALGVGLLPGQPPWLGERPWLKRRPRLAALLPTGVRGGLVAWAVSLGIIASSSLAISKAPLTDSFQAPQDRLALALKRIAPPGAKLWNWWDDGYFLAARSGLAPLFDGGSQSPQMAYIAAHPLVSDDPRFASRWIRFFALRGKEALGPLSAAWGQKEAVWRQLDAVFAAQDPRTVLASLPALGPGADWLFPQGRVYLYLPQRFLRISQWWFGLGSAPVPQAGTPRARIDTFKRTSFRFNPRDNSVVIPEEAARKGYADFGGVFVTSREPLAPPWGGGQPGPYVVTSELSPWLYIVDEDAIRSVGFRLLAPGGSPLPGFDPVLVNYAHGGLWEVLP